MKGIKLYTSVLLLFLSLLQVHAQTKAQLEKQRNENQRRISEASKILEQTKSKKASSIGQYQAVLNQINQREKLISAIQQEVSLLNKDISENEEILNALSRDLNNLKKEYAAMLYIAQKNQNAINELLFLFSAQDFNQFLRRLEYLDQYADARKSQAREIEEVQVYLGEQNAVLLIVRNEKEKLINQERREKEKLINLKEEKQSLLADLGKKEKSLKGELRKRIEDATRLERLMKDLVEREIKKSKSSKKTSIAMTPEAAQLASSFEKNKRKLPWPVISGFIADKFGEHNHPVLKGVKVKNDGIDIQTTTGEAVRSVFEGSVLTVAIIPGNNSAVMIKHGNYITVYAGIRNVKVKKGDKVNTKDPIGEVYTDKDGVSKFQFQIWRNFDKLNPEDWLYVN